ncbi:BPSL0761 family protein [Paraburkholderia podalyriae]|uniref:Uncharacterized protein n=2 Tax=Paraburkholderia TaxID=1822464 RepID=A0ABR7PQM6_9BURK|nr:BPSL0761 family protein [Paraburkholderia podalyriae]MBC8748583.1 hypothetical protein [Paraburkholderia podalyriae]
MTMPVERTVALLRVRGVLIELSRADSLKKLKELRHEAVTVLRHYPSVGDVEIIAKTSCWLEWPY